MEKFWRVKRSFLSPLYLRTVQKLLLSIDLDESSEVVAGMEKLFVLLIYSGSISNVTGEIKNEQASNIRSYVNRTTSRPIEVYQLIEALEERFDHCYWLRFFCKTVYLSESVIIDIPT